MTFTIASGAREALSNLVVSRIKREQEEYDRRTREYEEVRLDFDISFSSMFCLGFRSAYTPRKLKRWMGLFQGGIRIITDARRKQLEHVEHL